MNLPSMSMGFEVVNFKEEVLVTAERREEEKGTPTPWLTLLLVLQKNRVKQNSC